MESGRPDTRPGKNSLRLLPSGPDRVHEQTVRGPASQEIYNRLGGGRGKHECLIPNSHCFWLTIGFYINKKTNLGHIHGVKFKIGEKNRRSY